MMPIGRKPRSTTRFAWKGASFAGELCVDTARARAVRVKSSQVKSSQPKNTLPIPEIVMPWTVSFRELWIGWHAPWRSWAMRLPRSGLRAHDERDEIRAAPACVACSCDRTEHR